MADLEDHALLEALLDAWDRSSAILINLIQALPDGGLEARALEGSPTVAEMLTHLHHERMISLSEEAGEFAGEVPEVEWLAEADARRIEEMLRESARRVRDAVKDRIESGQSLARSYDHPVLLLQLLMFHDAYHHGQIKLALKAASCSIPDEVAGPMTWDVWRQRTR